MKSNSIKLTTVLIFTILFAFASSANAQGLFDKVKNKVKEQTDKVKEQTDKAQSEINKTQSEAGEAKTGDIANTKSIKDEGKLYGFVYINVMVKGKFGKQTSRTYVSEIVPVSSGDYKKYFDDSSHNITDVKGNIWKYFAETVVAAAKERGEEIEEPYDGSINYKYNIYSYSEGNNSTLRYHPQSYLEEFRNGELDHAKKSGRPAYIFRWDPTGKNTKDDLAKEKNRGTSKDLPN